MWFKRNWRALLLIILAVTFPLTAFLISFKIYKDLYNIIPSMWIAAPNKPMGISKNNNLYISSFFGSPLMNYVTYKQNEKLPNGLNRDDISFYGDLNKMKNFVNDTANFNLWKNDSDYVQFVVKTNDSDITKMEISIENNNQDNITYIYGWNTLVYAQNKKLLPNGGKFWTAERTTKNHILNQVHKNFVYTCWIKVISKNNLKPQNLTSNLNLKIYQNSNLLWQQNNTINLKLSANDYLNAENLKKEPIGFNYFNNDQWMLYYYLKNDVSQRNKIVNSSNIYDAYLKWAWEGIDGTNGYLKKFWQKMAELKMNYYTTFIGNITEGIDKNADLDHNGIITQKELDTYTTVNFNQNDPSMMTWHVKNQNGKWQVFLPDYEKQAYLYNLKNVLNCGIKNIFLRGFSEIKYYEKPDAYGKYESKLQNWVYNENTKTLQKVEMSPYSGQSKKYFGLTSEEWNKLYLNWFYQNVYQNSDFDLDGVNVYLYFDEVKEFEIANYNNLLTSMRLENNKTMRDYFKIGWCGVSMYSEFTKDIDNADLIYINAANLDDFKNNKIIKTLIKKRKEKKLLTGEYSLWDDNYNLGASNPGQTAYRILWGDAVGTPGYMRYTMTSWYDTSMWTTNDRFDNQSQIYAGDTIYVFPSTNPEKYVATSTRMEMASFAYNLILKLRVLGNTERLDNVYQLLNDDVAKMQTTKFDLRDFSLLSDEKINALIDNGKKLNTNLTSSEFINYLILKTRKIDLSPISIVLAVYSLVNK